MVNLDNTTPDETQKQDQTETMFERMERLDKELDSLQVELQAILYDDFDPCEMCGS